MDPLGMFHDKFILQVFSSAVSAWQLQHKKQSHVSHVHSLDILYLKKPRLWCKCIKTGINSCISTFSSRHVLRWKHFCLASWKPLSLQGSRWKRPCCFALKDSKAFALSISTPSRSNDSSMQLPPKIPFLLGSMVKLLRVSSHLMMNQVINQFGNLEDLRRLL